MRTFRPPVEVHGVAVLAVHGHGARLKIAFSDKTIKTKVVQNVAIGLLLEGPGVWGPAELLQDACEAVLDVREISLLLHDSIQRIREYYKIF